VNFFHVVFHDFITVKISHVMFQFSATQEDTISSGLQLSHKTTTGIGLARKNTQIQCRQYSMFSLMSSPLSSYRFPNSIDGVTNVILAPLSISAALDAEVVSVVSIISPVSMLRIKAGAVGGDISPKNPCIAVGDSGETDCDGTLMGSARRYSR
jgi:hypothetical protein